MRCMRRFRSLLGLWAVSVPVSVAFEWIGSGDPTMMGVSIGVLLALPLTLYQDTGIDDRLRRLPFTASMVSRAALYLGSLLLVFTSTSLVVGLLTGRPIEEFWEWLGSGNFAAAMAVGFALYILLIFFRQLDRLLGPGVLWRYLAGRYHRPRRENRIFMFLDLKSSTTLAEEMGPERYVGMVNEFFRDLSGPVLDRSAEIYEYVGDEVVLTWPAEVGLRHGNCIRVFFDIEAAVERKRDVYLERFGVVPEFKAGMHMGEVMTAEVGDLKRSLVFNGDVLNTGSRIESQCNPLGRRFLVSEELLSQVGGGAGWRAEHLGEIPLRGKHEPMALAALS